MHGDDRLHCSVHHDRCHDLGSHSSVQIEHHLEVRVSEGAQTVVLDHLTPLHDLQDDGLPGHVRSLDVPDRLDARRERLAGHREELWRLIHSKRDPTRTGRREKLLDDPLQLVDGSAIGHGSKAIVSALPPFRDNVVGQRWAAPPDVPSECLDVRTEPPCRG